MQRDRPHRNKWHWQAFYLVMLVDTALFILRKKGIRSLIDRLVKWMRGERRYATDRDTFRSYRFYQNLFEPNPLELAQQRTQSRAWLFQPTFGVVTAVYNAPLPYLRETYESLRNQSYENWLWFVVDASDNELCWHYLTEQGQDDSRIKIVRRVTNQGISINTNYALQAAERDTSVDFIVMLDHDDTLAPFALFDVAQCLHNHPEADMVYSDSDKLDGRGRRCEPLFKPDWSPEMILSCNFLSQISIFKRGWLTRIGFLNPELDGAQDWDLYLRITEHTSYVYHISKVLYHWRKTSLSTAASTHHKPYIRQAQKKALISHMNRIGLSQPDVLFDDSHLIRTTRTTVTWKLRKFPVVSIIIPSKDHADVLSRCLKSLFELTTYSAFEIIVVDTGSTEAETYQLYKSYATEPRFQTISCMGKFNFSIACNFGALHGSGEVLLFLNNDTEILHGDWLERLLQWLEHDGIGIVGAKLLYPSGRLQHAGVIVGMGGLASHLFLNSQENLWSAFGTDHWYRNLLAVTAACLLIPHRIFENVGGFDESFELNYSDVDLCLKVHEAGYRIVYTPDARLIHHESISHGRQIPRTDFVRAAAKWTHWLSDGDPYFNANLTYRSTDPHMRADADDTPARLHQQLMASLPDKTYLQLPDDLNLRSLK